MNNYDKITLGFVILLIIIQLFFPLTTVFGEIVTAPEANLKYFDIHWSFNYFMFMIVAIVIGLVLFLITLKEKYRKFHSYTYWIWFIAIIIIAGTLIPMENYLKSQNSLVTDIYNIANAIPSLFILDFIILNGLIEVIKKGNKKAVKEKKKPIDLKKIIIVGIVFPLSTLIGIKIGAGGLIGGVLGGIISYFLIKLFDKKSKVKKNKK